MFETLLSLLRWSWNHPEVVCTSLSGIAFIFIMWLHVPKELTHYYKNGKLTIRPFNVRNEIPGFVFGRIAVWRFCRKHGIKLAFGPRLGKTLIECLLFLLGISNPRVFSWDGCFASAYVYPLGHTRREYIGICLKYRMWPWRRAKTLQHILDENKGYLPVFRKQRP